MGVRPGYKQTQVGVIPRDWDVVPIGEHFQFKNGLNKAKEFFGFGTPIVNYMDVFQRPCLRVDEILGRVDVNARELRAYEVRQGDVFFTRTSEVVDEVGIASVMLDEAEDTVFSGFVLRARPTDQSLDNLFKSYCFTARYFRQQVIARASYTTRALTNGRSLSAALLACPPPPEQRAIAAALSDVDALLGGLELLIAKKRDLKQAAMQQLLTGQTRLPGFSGEWEVKRLGDVIDFTNGKPHESHIDSTGHYYLVTLDSIGIDGKLKAQHKPIRLLDNSLAKDDIVTILSDIAHGNLLGLCDLIPENNRYVLNQRVGRLRVKPELEVNPQFLRLQINRRQYHFKMRGQGTSQRHIYRRDFEQLALELPTFAEQTAIAAVLSDMDVELSALEARRDKTRALKQTMMQELLTGKTRLVSPEVTHV